jgi:type II secretory pathway pseudopilin PulG
MDHTSQARGFALVELLAVLLCAVLIASVLLVMGDSARRNARIGEDLSSLRRIGALTQSYGADYNDLMWSFSWRPGNYTTQWPDLQSAWSDIEAGGYQAVAIMRELSGNPDLPRLANWFPHVLFSHLVLADYADDRSPVRWAVSSGDRHRLKWIEDPECFAQGCFSPYQPGVSTFNLRWAYSASFSLPPAFYDRSPVPHRISQSSTGSMNMYSTGGSFSHLFGVQLSEIAHPSAKVMFHDVFSWHFGSRQPVFLLPEARVPLLFSDGSADVRRSGDANAGWINPRDPSHPPTVTPWLVYSPTFVYEPPAVTGSQDVGFGYYRWTRMGIEGRDFGGPEVWP